MLVNFLYHRNDAQMAIIMPGHGAQYYFQSGNPAPYMKCPQCNSARWCPPTGHCGPCNSANAAAAVQAARCSMLEAELEHEKKKSEALAQEHAELTSNIQTLTQTINGQLASLDESRIQQISVNQALQREAGVVQDSLREMNEVCQTFKVLLNYMQNSMVPAQQLPPAQQPCIDL